MNTRTRRLKLNPFLRKMVRENQLSLDDLVYPMSVDANLDSPAAVETMPGIVRFPIKSAIQKAKQLIDVGVHSLYIMGVPKKNKKDGKASDAFSDDGVVPQVVDGIKTALGDKMIIIGDSYLGYFTDHQIGGVLDKNMKIMDEPTLESIRKIAVKWAKCGVDIFCNATMVDGRVKAAREALDAAGCHDTLIMSSIKFNSAFYAPGAGITQTGGSYTYDKSVYYNDPANSEDPLRMARLDVDEGADMINVKPALPFLDMIYRIKTSFPIPVSTFSISGDYAMIAFGSQMGNLSEKDCALELMTSLKRAGADIIISYWADKVSKWL